MKLSKKANQEIELAADLELLSSSIGSGLSLEQASEYLTRFGSPTNQGLWSKLHQRLSGGVALNLALQDLRVNAASRWVDDFCELVITCDIYRNQSLASELNVLASWLRQYATARQEIQQRIGSAKSIAYLALCAPWILLLVLSGREENRTIFFSAMGFLVLLAGVFASAVAAFASARISKIPNPVRVFE